MSDSTIAITSFSGWQHVKSLEFAMMFLTFERADHLLDQIVDVEDLHLYASVIDLDREVIGDIVAERGDGRIVVRTAPFSVKVRETIDEYFRTGLLAVFEEEILAGFLAPAVFAVAETSCQ